MLIIEVADSSLKYDQTITRDLYAETGVAEYWISDLQNDCVIAYCDIQDKLYRNMQEFRRGSVLNPTLLPTCGIPVDVLLP